MNTSGQNNAPGSVNTPWSVYDPLGNILLNFNEIYNGTTGLYESQPSLSLYGGNAALQKNFTIQFPDETPVSELFLGGAQGGTVNNGLALNCGLGTIFADYISGLYPAHLNCQQAYPIGTFLAASPPTVAPGAASGVGATTTFANDANPTDAAFRVSLTTGTGPGTGTIFSVTFAQPYRNKPKVVFTGTAPNSTGSALYGAHPDANSITVNGFNFITGSSGALNASTGYQIDFIVVG